MTPTGPSRAAVSRRRGSPTPVVSKIGVDGCSFDDSTGEPLGYAALNSGLPYEIASVAGSSFSVIGSRYATHAAAGVDLMLVGGAGPNDLPSLTVDQYLQRQNACLALYRAALPTRALIGTCGLPPLDEGIDVSYTGYNAKRRAVNAANRAAVGNGLIDFYMPRYEHPITGADSAGTNTSYFATGDVHPGGAALTDGNATCAAAVNAIIAQKGLPPSSDPSAFTITDSSNVTTSTVTSSRFVVQGLGLGKTAWCSVVSGGAYIARNYENIDASGNAQASTPFEVMCGDVVTVTLTSSASASTDVSAVIAVGNKTDTYTVSTAAPSGIIFEDTFTGSSGALTTTETGGKTWYGNGQKDGSGNLVLGQSSGAYAAADPGTGTVKITWTGAVAVATAGAHIMLAFGGDKSGSGGTDWTADFSGKRWWFISLTDGKIFFHYEGGNTFVERTFTAQSAGTYDVELIAKPGTGTPLALSINGTPMTLGAGDGNFYGSSHPPTGTFVGVYDESRAGGNANNKLSAIKVEVAP